MIASWRFHGALSVISTVYLSSFESVCSVVRAQGAHSDFEAIGTELLRVAHSSKFRFIHLPDCPHHGSHGPAGCPTLDVVATEHRGRCDLVITRHVAQRIIRAEYEQHQLDVLQAGS